MFPLVLIAFLLMSIPSPTIAKDFGVEGHTYAIQEEDILKVIQQRLKTTDLNKINSEQQKIVEQYIANPKPVENIKTTQQEKEFLYDTTYVLTQDILDDKGKVLHKSGTKVNPFDHVSLTEELLFIDGTDQGQVLVALKLRQEKNQKLKIILVKGSPVELQKKHKVWIYFDQEGVLVKKLGVTQVPALVSQEGKHLKIKEFKIEASR